MAGQRQAGPLCGHSNPVNVDDGTMCRAESPRPGSVSSGIATRSVSTFSSTFTWAANSIGAEYDSVSTTLHVKYGDLQRGLSDDLTGALCIYQAYVRAEEFAPDAILEETGYQLKSLISGLLPGLLQILAIIGASTFLGAGIGGLIGALAGGVGAAPGAVVGADLGFDVGMAALTWLGVAFLAVSIAKGFAELLEAIRNGVEWAWAARKLKGAAQDDQLDKAAHELARSAGILVRLVLQGILAYLLKKAAMGATRGAVATARGAQLQGAAAVSEATVAELVGKLRASRFDDGFADWVEKNWQDLEKNPKLQAKETTKPMLPNDGAGGGSANSEGGGATQGKGGQGRSSSEGRAGDNRADAADASAATAVSQTVYRVDGRPPGTIFNEGFQPKGTSTDLENYVLANQPSAFVSTSKIAAIAENPAFAKPGTYLYEVDGSMIKGIDVNQAYPDNPFANESEIAVVGGVPRDAIISAKPILPGGGVGPTIPNPFYSGGGQ